MKRVRDYALHPTPYFYQAFTLYLLPQRWLILITLNAVYLFVYFHRISTAVLAPYLMDAFSASAASLGGMSSAYFYPYALSQPLVGLLTDRWGARKVVTLSTVIAFAGAFLFGWAPTLLFATLGRGLIGLGAGGVFVPALKVLLPWFGPKAFAQMNVLLLATGNVGAIVASTPYAWFIQQIGWRNSFFFIGGLTFLFAVLSWTSIRDFPPDIRREIAPAKEVHHSIIGSFADILKNRFYWIMAALFFTYAGPFSTFQGLWGYPFLIDIFKYDKLQASNLLMTIALGAILGGPFLGYLADKTFATSRRTLLSISIGVQFLNWSGIVFLGPSLGYLSLALIFFLMGMTLSGTLSLIWSIVREISPQERLGTVMGLLNPAPFLGVAIFQPLTGYLMDRVGKIGGAFPLEAYQHAFGLCLFSISISLVISFFLIRTKGRR
ncbi:MAG: MFS transporter [Deltaproteobacteria bacterium]|nr:MFS transporter [Deltaproteobacteria bacterium]